MPVNVGHGLSTKRTHHIKLTDIAGSNTMGLKCVLPNGEEAQAIQVHPYPGTASQLKQGRSKYSDKIPPFLDVPLHDFSGGMGLLHSDEDESRYQYGYKANTTQAGRTMLQGRPTYTKGIRDFNEYQPGIDVLCEWKTIHASVTTSHTASFTTTAAYDAAKAFVSVRKVGSPTGNVTLSILNASDVEQVNKTIDCSNIPAYSPYLTEFEFSSALSLSDATVYKVQVAYSGGDASNYIQLWFDDANSKFPFRVIDDTTSFSMLPFEYRGAFYCITQPEDMGDSSIYLLGYRGLADANTGALTTTLDGNDYWTVDALIGYEVRIVAGPGSEEVQTWRTITDNAAGSLTHATWNVEHTTDTEYVITDDTWRLVEALDFYCSDVVVTDRVLWLASGDNDDYLHRMRWGNDDQTWTWDGEVGVSEDAEAFKANKLVAIPHSNPHGRRKTYDLYVGRNNNYDGDKVYPNSVTRLNTPPFYGSPYITTGQLVDGSSWVAESITNVTASADKQWARLDVAAGFVTGALCTKELAPVLDISDAEGFVCGIYTSVNMDAGDLELVLLDAKDNSINLDFPALTAEDDLNDAFKWVTIDLHSDDTAPSHSYIDLSRIKRIQLNLAVDKGAQIIKLGKSGIWTYIRPGPVGQFAMSFGEKINGMVEYGGGGGQVIRRPWIGTTKNVYYVEGDHLLPIYLRELEELEHERNCELMGVNDVYLYFNIGKKLQRYYAGQLDNIGPEVDYPLPSDRAGYPCTMASYPGRAIVGYDCESTGYSWIGYRRNHGWHELYRSAEAGARIRKIHALARLSTIDQLFVSEGADIMYLPLSTNSETEDDFPYVYHGHVESARIYGSPTRETEKYFHDFQVIQEYHDETTSSDKAALIRVYYRTNNQNSYTLIENFDTVPKESNDIGTNNVEGNWIQFLIGLETGKAKYSPILVSGLLGALERLKIKNTYKYRVVLKEGYDKTLDGGTDDLTGKEKYDLLTTWVNDPLPLTLTSNSSYEDGKIVMLEPKPARLVSFEIEAAGREKRVYEITLIEVE